MPTDLELLLLALCGLVEELLTVPRLLVLLEELVLAEVFFELVIGAFLVTVDLDCTLERESDGLVLFAEFLTGEVLFVTVPFPLLLDLIVLLLLKPPFLGTLLLLLIVLDLFTVLFPLLFVRAVVALVAVRFPLLLERTVVVLFTLRPLLLVLVRAEELLEVPVLFLRRSFLLDAVLLDLRLSCLL